MRDMPKVWTHYWQPLARYAKRPVSHTMNWRFLKVGLPLILGISWHLPPLAAEADPRFRYNFRPAHIGTFRQPQCHTQIIRALKSSIDGRAKVHIGSFQNIETLLERAQMFDYDVAGVMAWLDGQKAKRVDHPIFKRTLTEISRTDSTSELFVCVMRRECEFKGNASAVHLNQSAAVVQEDFPRTRPADVPARLRRRPNCVGLTGLKEELHTILVRVPQSGLNLETATTRSAGREARRNLLDEISHEVTHAADHDLFSDWILANYELIASKRYDEVDELFLKLTRERNDQLIVDKGFFTTFLESRGYAVSDYVQNQHYKDTDGRWESQFWGQAIAQLFAPSFASIPRKDYAAHAIKAIRDEGGGWFLDRNHVNATNLFDFGIKLGNRFEKVIRLARLPERL